MCDHFIQSGLVGAWVCGRVGGVWGVSAWGCGVCCVCVCHDDVRGRERFVCT